MILAFCFLQILFVSYLLASCVKKWSAVFIIFIALIVLNVEIASVFHQINPIFLQFLGLVEILLSIIFWRLKNKPLLTFSPCMLEIKDAILSERILIILFIAYIFMLFISFILGAFSPPTEADALSYHCVRPLFWAESGYIYHFDVSDVRCHSMPVNSEIIYTWIYTLSKKDTMFGLVQFLSYFGILFSSFNIMRFFEIDIKRILWSIFIFSSFPIIISQISSTQTDLLVGSMLLLSLDFILSYSKEKKVFYLFLSSIAMALAMGTKSTGVMMSLPLIVYYCFLAKKDILKFFPLLFFNFLIFSSYNYILNFINYGNFLGSESAINLHSLYYSDVFGFFVSGFSNLVKYCFSLLDFSGLAPFILLSDIFNHLFLKVFSILNIDPYMNSYKGILPHLNVTFQEHNIGFGILGLFVLLPSFFYSFKTKFYPFTLMFFVSVLLLSYSIIYFPTSIRFFAAFSLFLIPLISFSYKNKFITFVAFLYLIFTPLFLPQRPLIKVFKLHEPLNIIQEKMRNLNSELFFVSSEAPFIKNEILSLGKNKQIGFFAGEAFYIYILKYYCPELKFLNADKSYDFRKFDFLIVKDGIQNISAVNNFIENNNCKIKHNKKGPYGKICYFDQSMLSDFYIYKILSYEASSTLIKAKMDENARFIILKNRNKL